MRNFWILLVVLSFFAALNVGCGSSSKSTRVKVDDDTKGPRSSGPYAADLVEVTDYIATELKRQRVIERFQAKWGVAPIVAVIRPQNDTRFPEVSQVFQEDLVVELMARWTRDELRFSQRDSDVQSAVEAEKEAKESGERTDRTGRRSKLGADYFLKAKFSTLSMTDGEYEDDMILYTYELIDTETDELIFKGGHKIRRVSSKSAVYR